MEWRTNFHATKMSRMPFFVQALGRVLSTFLLHCDFFMFSWRAEMSLFTLHLAPVRGGRGFSPVLAQCNEGYRMHSQRPALSNPTGTSEHNGRLCEESGYSGRSSKARPLTLGCSGSPPRALGTLWFHRKLTHRRAVGRVEITCLSLELPACLQSSTSLI